VFFSETGTGNNTVRPR